MFARLRISSLLAFGLVLVTGAACRPTAPPRAPTPWYATPPPPLVAPPVVAPLPPVAPLDPNAFDPQQITLVLDDPRLAAVKAAADRDAFAEAVAALATALASPALSADDRRAWLYQLGHLRLLAGDPLGAAKAFRDAAATPWVLADYAHLQAAQAYAGSGKYDAALAEAKAIASELPIAAGVDLVFADALRGKNDVDGAASHWRAYLSHEKKPHGWVNVTLAFANALLQRPSAAHAEEAIRLARMVIYESPGGAGAGNAKEIETQALATLPHAKRHAFEHPGKDELLARARGLAGSGQSREAVLVTDKLVKMPHAKKPGEFACEVWLTRGDALAKMRPKKVEAADAYEGAVAHCAGQAALPDALYRDGRALASAGRQREAVTRLAQLEKEFPRHKLADDARLRRARAARDGGDAAEAEALLASIADDYPDGDVVNDGLVELALHRAVAGAWKGAIVPLERALARAPRERAYFAAGRLPYYLARARLATGDAERAWGEFAGVIRDYPLSYYMALAYARLAQHDTVLAAKVLADGFAREPEGAFTVTRGAWADDPAFVRARELVRQGDAKLARGELDRLGVGSRTAPAELAMASAFLLARGGAITQSHNLLRAASSSNASASSDAPNVAEWLDHYPAGRFRAAWEVAYPRPWANIVTAEAARENISPAFAYAIMREESAFDPHAASGAKAFGLMQLIVPTAQKMAESLGLRADEEMLKQPGLNIAVGCRYLAILRGKFADNPLLAIPGYNAGDGAPKKWIAQRPSDDFDLWVEQIPYEETRLYTKRVITSLLAYEEIYYARERRSEALAVSIAASPSAKAASSSAAAP